MAAAAPFLSLAMGVVGAVGQFKAAGRQDDAADTQQEAARQSQALRERNATLIEAEGQESMRRQRREDEREEGMTRARSMASGTTGGGTNNLYLADLKGTNKEELDWLDYSTKSRVGQERAGGYYDYLTGSAAAQATRSQAKTTRMGAWTGLMGSASQFGDSQGWWQK
jgi:hypothetical protein